MALFLEWRPFAASEGDGDGERGFDASGEGLDGGTSDAGGADLFDLTGLSLVLGLELPTGEDADAPQAGVTPPSLLQLGSGTFDPIVGLRYERSRDGVFVFAAATVQLSGGASDNGLRPGTSAELAAGGGIELLDRLAGTLALEAAWRDDDELDGTSLDNTGSTLLFVTPGFIFDIAERISLDVSVRWPLWRHVDGTQLVPGPRWSIGLLARL